MKTLLHPTYFPNISHMIAMAQSDVIVFEEWDNYQKQTYRNRCEIYAANGRLTLTVPVKYTQKKRQHYKDVKIANETNWQLQHLRSLQSAYRTSPFYEYYEDELRPLFEQPFHFIMDLNYHCLDTLMRCLDLDVNYQKTTIFEASVADTIDLRHLANTNDHSTRLKTYFQLFSDKHGFIPNLSILDLLFHEGPSALSYLRSQIFNI